MFLGLEKKLWLECHLSLWVGKEDDRREQTYFLGQTRETQSSWAFYMPFQPSPSGRARIGLGIGRPAGTGPEGGDSAHSLAGQRGIPVAVDKARGHWLGEEREADIERRGGGP